MSTSTASVRVQRRGPLGLLTLDRPRALHALDTPTCAAIDAALRRWADDPDVRAVVVRASQGPAFCAGGDVRAVRRALLDGDPAAARGFFRTEYRMNHRMRRYAKPIVSLINGYCFGGGMGVAMHGSFRVAGEDARFAMPEAAIGLFPDVGMSYVLARAPGELGTWFGLTGARIGPHDARHMGLVTHVVDGGRFDDVVGALADRLTEDALAGDPIGAFGATAEVLQRLALAPARAPLLDHRARIDAAFAAHDVASILAALDNEDEPWSEQAAATLRRHAPTSLAVSLRLLRLARTMPFERCLQLEFRLACALTRRHDFLEGVRAVLVDKDRDPSWQPSSVGQLTASAVAACFAPLDPEVGELALGGCQGQPGAS